MTTAVLKLIAEIGLLRVHLVETPILDNWLAIVDPPIVRSQIDIDEFIKSLMDNADRWNALWGRLDERSQQVLRAILLFRAVGYQRFTMPWISQEALAGTYSKARAMIVADYSSFTAPPYPISRFEIEYSGHIINLEAWLGNIASTFIVRQYLNNIARIKYGDIIVDAGACFGDTTLAFAADAGSAGRVLSFEPSPNNAILLQKNVASNPLLSSRIEIFETALSDKVNHQLPFLENGAGSMVSSSGLGRVRSDTLDHLCEERRIDRIDFIKMDVEFHEASVLLGCAQTIRKFKPRLAVAAYHRPDDLLTLSELVLDLHPEYVLHIGHITASQSETVLFAV